MKKLSFLIIGFIVLCNLNSNAQSCTEMLNIPHTSKVNFESNTFEVTYRYYYSLGDFLLSVKIKQPKIISYNYKGKTYNADEFGFSNYKPISNNNSIYLAGCFKKSKGYKINSGKVFNLSTGGDLIVIASSGEAYKNDEQFKQFKKENDKYTESDICSCSVLGSLDYSNIEAQIEKVLKKG
ncbi:hypothetical protein [Aequorivita nionensis]|uniref:hypothetical protein n=1 Tax=Aequorivita nionensis TaxID=1287690 RepID=UPI003965D311